MQLDRVLASRYAAEQPAAASGAPGDRSGGGGDVLDRCNVYEGESKKQAAQGRGSQSPRILTVDCGSGSRPGSGMEESGGPSGGTGLGAVLARGDHSAAETPARPRGAAGGSGGPLGGAATTDPAATSSSESRGPHARLVTEQEAAVLAAAAWQYCCPPPAAPAPGEAAGDAPGRGKRRRRNVTLNENALARCTR